jgi:hypothetical protein
MRKELLTLTILLSAAAVSAAEINLTEISESVTFFDAKGGVLQSRDTLDFVLFGFFGGGFIVILIGVVFVGIIFYKYKYSSKEGGALREEDLFKKYNY